MIALTKNGEAWGYGTPDSLVLPSKPGRIDQGAKKVVAGYASYMWEKTDNTFWGMGFDSSGMFGQGEAMALKPVRLGNGLNMAPFRQ